MPRGEARRPLTVSRRELRIYAANGLLGLAEAGPSEADLRRARRIRRLHRDLGLSYEAIEVVLALVDRLEAGQPAAVHERRSTVRITVLGP
jgi:DNA-binding transcriptional MerR regulator